MNSVNLINIGFGNIVPAGRIIAIVSPESAPIKRFIQDSRDEGTLLMEEEQEPLLLRTADILFYPQFNRKL